MQPGLMSGCFCFISKNPELVAVSWGPQAGKRAGRMPGSRQRVFAEAPMQAKGANPLSALYVRRRCCYRAAFVNG